VCPGLRSPPGVTLPRREVLRLRARIHRSCQLPLKFRHHAQWHTHVNAHTHTHSLSLSFSLAYLHWHSQWTLGERGVYRGCTVTTVLCGSPSGRQKRRKKEEGFQWSIGW
jgi:hypothetical protein